MHKEKWRDAIRKSGTKSEKQKLSVDVKTWKPVSPIKEERCSQETQVSLTEEQSKLLVTAKENWKEYANKFETFVEEVKVNKKHPIKDILNRKDLAGRSR